jgi:hypothetical protein
MLKHFTSLNTRNYCITNSKNIFQNRQAASTTSSSNIKDLLNIISVKSNNRNSNTNTSKINDDNNKNNSNINKKSNHNTNSKSDTKDFLKNVGSKSNINTNKSANNNSTHNASKLRYIPKFDKVGVPNSNQKIFNNDPSNCTSIASSTSDLRQLIQSKATSSASPPTPSKPSFSMNASGTISKKSGSSNIRDTFQQIEKRRRESVINSYRNDDSTINNNNQGFSNNNRDSNNSNSRSNIGSNFTMPSNKSSFKSTNSPRYYLSIYLTICNSLSLSLYISLTLYLSISLLIVLVWLGMTCCTI